MKKPVYTLCKQQRCRSACTSVQPAHLCSLISTFVDHCLDTCSIIFLVVISPIPWLTSFSCWAGLFESYLVANPRVWFSCDRAQKKKETHLKLLLLPAQYWCGNERSAFGRVSLALWEASIYSHAYYWENVEMPVPFVLADP